MRKCHLCLLHRWMIYLKLCLRPFGHSYSQMKTQTQTLWWLFLFRPSVGYATNRTQKKKEEPSAFEKYCNVLVKSLKELCLGCCSKRVRKWICWSFYKQAFWVNLIWGAREPEGTGLLARHGVFMQTHFMKNRGRGLKIGQKAAAQVGVDVPCNTCI